MSGVTNPADFRECQVLEEISNRIRSGEPVGIVEALAAIEYQQARRQWVAHNSMKNRVLRFVRSIFRKGGAA